jgi:DNA-binding NarL/FixJ family response regulator
VPATRRPPAVPPGRGRESPDRAILVVDDHVTFAEALAAVLDEAPGLTAQATTIEQVQRVLAEHDVDLILLEVDLAGDDAVRFARRTLSGHPHLRILAVTASQDESRAVEAVRAGISGWVPKDEPVDVLLAVIRGALRGETSIPPRLLTHVLAELVSAQQDTTGLDHVLATLTRREHEILDCLMRGMKTDDIAKLLCLSVHTLRTHIRNILGKLNVHSILAAVALARQAETYPDSSPRADSAAPAKR